MATEKKLHFILPTLKQRGYAPLFLFLTMIMVGIGEYKKELGCDCSNPHLAVVKIGRGLWHIQVGKGYSGKH